MHPALEKWQKRSFRKSKVWKSTAPARKKVKKTGNNRIKRNKPTNGAIRKDSKEEPLTTKEKIVHKR
jgi:hypothetical protein